MDQSIEKNHPERSVLLDRNVTGSQNEAVRPLAPGRLVAALRNPRSVERDRIRHGLRTENPSKTRATRSTFQRYEGAFEPTAPFNLFQRQG